MAGEGSDLFHCWILPNIDLILAISMSGHNLIRVLGEHQITHLTACLNRVEQLELASVPELDGSILCTTT